MFKKITLGIYNKIIESLNDKFGKVSHTKISSYIILLNIVLTTFVFLVIDIVNAITVWNTGEIYIIPGSHIGIFTMILGHHLFLLGIKKYSEKISQNDKP